MSAIWGRSDSSRVEEASASLTPDIPFEFPVILLLIPVIREIFPVNFHREFNEKSLQRRGFPLKCSDADFCSIKDLSRLGRLRRWRPARVTSEMV
jgi:hypothetical protein